MALPQPRIQPEPELPSRPQPEPGHWTYADYCAIPEDGHRYEVIEGQLYVAPSPTPLHQRAVSRLAYYLIGHTLAHDLGEIFVAPLDVVLSLRTVVQPDILFLRKERLSIVTGANIPEAPDLVVEVLSPGTRAYDRIRKRDAYAAYGVQWYWMVDPQRRTLEEYERREGVYVLTQQCSGEETVRPLLFPGLGVPLALLWH
jgi:Uma2 family endonuclease